MSATFEMACYGGKRGVKTFRNPSSVAEMIAHFEMNRGEFWYRMNDGSAKNIRRNGAIKRWKREAGRVEIPVKFGIYECARLTADDMGRVLIEVVSDILAPTLAPANTGLAPTLGGR